MSLWEFAVCVAGWNKAQGGEEPLEPLSVDEYDRDIAAWRQQTGRVH